MKKKQSINTKTSAQALISRLPYSKSYDIKPILNAVNKIDIRGIAAISIPIHTENPVNAFKLIAELQEAGMNLISVIAFHRDRHIVTTRSKRLSNAWEPIVVFSKSKDWYIDRDGPARPKRGVSGREEQFDEDEFLTCVGDHFPIRSDKRDRRFLPAQVTLNIIQLAGLNKGDSILDPWGNPAIKEQCELLGIKYIDDNMPSQVREDWKKKTLSKKTKKVEAE